jgi:hypothetical protein
LVRALYRPALTNDLSHRWHGSEEEPSAKLDSEKEGFTLFYWAIATLWIPMLLVLGVWRYLICGLPLAYDPLY